MNKSSRIRGLKVLVIIVCALTAALIVNSFLIINARVVDGSMEPTLNDGSMIVAWRLSYLYTSPQRGDVVLFSKQEVTKGMIIKRIAGVPGDRVKNKSGNILTVPKDSYFVTGDNSLKSFDSREWEEPFVKREDILGKAAFMYFPKLEIIE